MQGRIVYIFEKDIKIDAMDAKPEDPAHRLGGIGPRILWTVSRQIVYEVGREWSQAGAQGGATAVHGVDLKSPRDLHAKQGPPQRPRAGAPTDGQIYGQIYAAIVEHDLTPGTKLPEDALAETFGVSRTRVRKILQQLAHEGLVQLERHRGASVARPSPKEARDVFEVRHLLEVGMMRQVTGRATPREVTRLRRQVLLEREAYGRGDRRHAITLSGQFHLDLARLADNTTLLEFLRALVSRTSLILALYAPAGGPICLCDEHEALIDAVARGDGAAAGRVMQEHLEHITASLRLSADEDKPVDLRALFQQIARRQRGAG
jgi:DNA-binding GntR family transcriptional regulator